MTNKAPVPQELKILSILSIFSILLFLSCQGLTQPPPSSILPIVDGTGEVRVSHGNLEYSLGGLDDEGIPSARVFVSLRDESGSLGTWIETTSLPEGRCYASAFVVASSAGNLIYVLGGEGNSGLSSSIFFTFIHPDGSLGFNSPGKWEISSRPLPEPRSRAGWVLYDGRIFLLGGQLKEGKTSSIIHGRLNQDGQLGQWYISPQTLPSPRNGVRPAIQGARLFVDDGSGAISFTLGDHGLLENLRNELTFPQAQDRPLVAPGSGLVTTKASVQIQLPFGSTLRFREDSFEVTMADPVWDPTYRILADCILSLRSFSSDLQPSPQVYRKYRTRKSSFLTLVEPDYIPIHPPGSLTMGTLVLQETQSFHVLIPQNSAWFRLSLPSSEKIILRWADIQTTTEFTGSIEFTLFEDNLYTEVLDRRGKPVTNFGSLDTSPWVLDLNPGMYYLQVRDKNGETGRSFGLGISRE